MPSKGILITTYTTVPSTTITLSVPGQTITKSSLRTHTHDHLEVDSANLPRFKFTGRFSFTVQRSDRELTTQWVDINSLTGKLEDGTIHVMDATASLLLDGLVICYGFYDAGPGVAGLPKQHLCYVTVTTDLGDWMGTLLPQSSPISQRPFNRMVLPGAHDVGMNTMSTALTLLEKAGSGAIKEVLGRELPHALDTINKLSDSAVGKIAPDIVRALAVTQKDSLDALLRIGARYFEFRPAKCHRRMMGDGGGALEDTWFFQHGAIPGMAYKAFLEKVVGFVDEHEGEIIVVQLRWDGVPKECPRPSGEDLQNVLKEVMKGKRVEVGNLDDMMRKSIRELRDEKKRLIMLQNVNQVSNYDDAANATLNGDSMVNKLKDMAMNPPKGHPITLLQCQATATNIRDVVVASVLDSDVNTSPILATKPVCDAKILPLLRGECGKDLMGEEGVVVLLNDFFDGATADVAIELCKGRMG
ncbi:PLC-like phosphodiesterase [Bimuria novae-zelandiae CBS 107.79]|uniref:PLC-like phosphodiesterase n=1 Tax=Bimuria novae-zelandiae CBS 107.79 TaxID=1447943 RepID=A0A6A5VRD0_9PLEO|nr:PLC-like phosphodiesterase [Bimuria novae-zelandiae CBS 107.79]